MCANYAQGQTEESSLHFHEFFFYQDLTDKSEGKIEL